MARGWDTKAVADRADSVFPKTAVYKSERSSGELSTIGNTFY